MLVSLNAAGMGESLPTPVTNETKYLGEKFATRRLRAMQFCMVEYCAVTCAEKCRLPQLTA